MTGSRAWRHPFRTLGFAFVIIATTMAIGGIVAINNPVICPAGGCIYNPTLEIAGLSLPSRPTLAMSGAVVLWTVKSESRREERESP